MTIADAGSKAATGNRKVTFRFTGIESARRMQNERDKSLGIVRHYMDVPVTQLDEGLAQLSGPNPRPLPNTNKKVARQIEASLLNFETPEVDVFHLAHLGITIVGDVVKEDDDSIVVSFQVDPEDSEEPADGVVNGLHSLAVIEKVLRESEVSNRQYVTFNVISGIPSSKRDTLIPWIARGRNTVLQAKDQSIDNLMGLFEPFKEAMSLMPYADVIGWEESAGTDYDVLDVLSILTALNPVAFPNEAPSGDEITHPVAAYEKQSVALKMFEDERYRDSFKQMIPLLPDALQLYDVIRSTATEKYNTGKRQAGHLRIVEKKLGKDGKARPNVWTFPFFKRDDGSYGITGTYRLSNAATYPMLAAFRVFVRQNAAQTRMSWEGGFKAVLKAWDDLGEEMMVSCVETSQSLGGANNINAVGKNRPLWRALHKTAKSYAAEMENKRLRAQLDQAKLAHS
jgi:hypothetical protein